nr:SHOCT domain-containing protein [Pseudanabaena sp. FACHB-2040]
MAALQQPAPAPALAPTPIPTPQSNLLAQLTQLAQLKEAGALTDDEFQLAKAKLLT